MKRYSADQLLMVSLYTVKSLYVAGDWSAHSDVTYPTPNRIHPIEGE